MKYEGGGETLKTINGIALPGAGNIVLNQYIQHYKWVSNVATTRKQVPAELRARDVKISYNDNSGVYHVEQYQSDDISDEAWGDDANWKGFRTSMTPIFERMPEVHFNDETGFYEVWLADDSGLDNVTEYEMTLIYQASMLFRAAVVDKTSICATLDARAVIPFTSAQSIVNSDSASFRNTFQKMNCEYVRVSSNITVESTCRMKYCYLTFGDNPKLKKIMPVGISLSMNKETTNMFRNCSSLTYFYFQRLNTDISLQYSPLVSVDSLSYLVDNASNTSAITITVHPEVYAKLTDEANAEWYAVNTAAQAKQITFATTE